MQDRLFVKVKPGPLTRVSQKSMDHRSSRRDPARYYDFSVGEDDVTDLGGL